MTRETEPAQVHQHLPCVECGSLETGKCRGSPCWCSCHGAPSGAFDFVQLAEAIGRVVNQKQQAYGDSFGKSGQVIALLYPEGIPPAKLGDALAVVRVLDKLFRIATDRDALGETPWRDIAGYALLATARVEAKR